MSLPLPGPLFTPLSTAKHQSTSPGASFSRIPQIHPLLSTSRLVLLSSPARITPAASCYLGFFPLTLSPRPLPKHEGLCVTHLSLRAFSSSLLPSKSVTLMVWDLTPGVPSSRVTLLRALWHPEPPAGPWVEWTLFTARSCTD